MDEESVAEFAVRAGLSPRRVRALIEGGSIRARQVGGQWLVDQSSEHRPAASRPLGARMRSHLLASLSGQPIDGLSAPERVRLRRYRDELVRSAEPDRMLGAWIRPVPALRLRVADADLEDLAADGRLVKSGFSDPRSEIAAAGQLEARVAASDADALRRDYLLRPSDQPNVLLHVSEQRPPSPVPLGLLLVDLAVHDGIRERSRVAALLQAAS
ncbi:MULTISPECIES: helix-turn-helix domain-containing protein [unclassified Curtobacterium]|uniref:helix-turn-helix domain-containing protein n=1 Tax=unclassified Curtobacterium TaxID=257496 RepID=UPI000F46DD38|nr:MULTISPECIES: helix-turn-helix domain-containing protein [unclassified Curtobacterium]